VRELVCARVAHRAAKAFAVADTLLVRPS